MGLKRKIPSLGLERRVRPRREEQWEEEPEDSSVSSGEDAGSDEESTGAGKGSGSDTDADSDSEAESDTSEPAATPKVDLSAISFGALARAQAALPPSQRRSKSSKPDPSANDTSREPPSRTPTKAKTDDPKPKRSSKHAPQEQSSKRPVSRRREILPDTKRKYRDPRFDSVGAGWVDEEKTKKAYAFLDEYRDSEMADLKVQIRKTKDPLQKETLKRQLLSMESKKKARLRKEEEEELLSEHRKKEKELVAQGKQPFYLKKSEQKKKLLTERYAGMSKGQVDRAIERKRKKISGKEKRELDWLQRGKPRT